MGLVVPWNFEGLIEAIRLVLGLVALFFAFQILRRSGRSINDSSRAE